MSTPTEAFAMEILADQDTTLLSRVAQRLVYIGVDVQSFVLSRRRGSAPVRIEILFCADGERADLLTAQLRRLVPVHSVRLFRATVLRTANG